MSEVFLTFDGGPTQGTPLFLQLLKKHQAKATFFVRGERARMRTSILRQIHEDGHTVGNNSDSMMSLVETGDAQVIHDEIAMTDAWIAYAGLPKPTLFRPPYLEWNETIAAVVAEQNLTPCFPTLDTQDFTVQRAGVIARRVLDKVEDGSIVRFTDGNENTLEALDRIIEGLRERDMSLRKL